MTWPEQLNENTLITESGEDEFSNFLEFNMHFPDLEGHGPAPHSQLQEHKHSMVHPPSHPATANTMATTAPTSTMTSEARSHPQYSATMEGLTMDFNDHGPVQSHPVPMPYSTPSMTPGFCAQDPSHHQPTMARQQQSHQPPANQHYMQGQPMIPPTPNSIELHGNAARYPPRVEEDSEMYDRYSRVNEEQVCLDPHSFPTDHRLHHGKALYTPLVSPAMTPLETQFRLPEYTIPGEYFTPLTSPALEAQNANSSNHHGHPFHARQVSDVGFVPTSAEINPLPGSSAPPSPSIIRKTNRQRTPTTSRLSGRNKVKQSPSIRAQTQRNRGRPMPPNSEEFYSSMTQELNKPQNNDVRSLQASSNEGSGQDSVSPEPLSEPLMPPPALPAPRKSPAIAPQPSQSPGTAATPATLMRIQRSQHAREPSNHFTGQAQLDYPDEVMEDIALPEAATPAAQPRPKMSRIDTSVRTSTASPVVSANVTPSLEPRSAPDRTPGSVAMSPRTVAMPSPSGPVPKKSEPSRSSLSGRKRPSLSSAQASPQLRPKISPSIQPLMRGGDHSECPSFVI